VLPPGAAEVVPLAGLLRGAADGARPAWVAVHLRRAAELLTYMVGELHIEHGANDVLRSRLSDLEELAAQQAAELARHHADFERWEDMANRGAQQVVANMRMRTLLSEALCGPVPEDWELRARQEVPPCDPPTSSAATASAAITGGVPGSGGAANAPTPS
jgi:hypothetical protein